MQYLLHFPHTNFIPDLEKRIRSINRFLKNHIKEDSAYRHYGIELYQPNFSVEACKRKSVRRFVLNSECKNHYLLGFFFFNSDKEEVGNLTLFLDLGRNLDENSKKDIKMFSLLASTVLDSVTFEMNNNFITIRFESDYLAQFISDNFSNVLNQDKQAKIDYTC